MKNASKNTINAFLCLVCFFSSATLARAVSLSFVPAVDGHYASLGSCEGYECEGDESVVSGSIFISKWVYSPGGWGSGYGQQIGLIEFDIASAIGLFDVETMNATLYLKIKALASSYKILYLYDYADSSEDGILELNDIYSLSYITGVQLDTFQDDIIQLDVTDAVAHDLFADDQSDFSGFALSSNSVSMPVTTGTEFYSSIDGPENAPMLVISGPVIVELSSFKAHPSSGSITISWSTASEINNAGFNLYRAEAESGPYSRINDVIIPARGSPSSGAAYDFSDHGLKNRKTYWYMLEDIDLNGTVTTHGPVSAMPKLLHGLFQ